MVKHITIDLDDKTHEALSKLKDEAGLTWAGVLIDWKKMRKTAPSSSDWAKYWEREAERVKG